MKYHITYRHPMWRRVYHKLWMFFHPKEAEEITNYIKSIQDAVKRRGNEV